MVEFDDGSVLAQLGNPDMRTPIAHALAWPERIPSGVAPLDFVSTSRLDFEAPDFERFPCLRLGFEAARAGGTAPAVLNAANEVAVDAFLNRRLRFTAIAPVAEATVEACAGRRTGHPRRGARHRRAGAGAGRGSGRGHVALMRLRETGI